MNPHRMPHGEVKLSSSTKCGDTELSISARLFNGLVPNTQDFAVGMSCRQRELAVLTERACTQIFPFSAQSETSLRDQLTAISHWISQDLHEIYSFLDLAHTLSARHAFIMYRHSLVATDYQELLVALDQNHSSFGVTHAAPAVTFIFTGQGAQWFAIGRDLIDLKSAFGVSLARSADILKALGATWDLIGELRCDQETSRIDRSEIAQPCSTAVQIALVDFIDALGIQPHAVIGHSSGEVAAAYAAGAIGQTAALKVAFYRDLISKTCNRDSSSKRCYAGCWLRGDCHRPTDVVGR